MLHELELQNLIVSGFPENECLCGGQTVGVKNLMAHLQYATMVYHTKAILCVKIVKQNSRISVQR